MLRYIALFLVIVGCSSISAQRSTASESKKIDGLFVSTFGDSTKQPIIFVHGGPGFNSRDFEVTTAEKLAALGYYVVSYDQRGQGRSDPTESKSYSYKQYADDLSAITKNLNLKSPILIGHSHGGPISIKFDEYYPNIAKAVVLVSAPVNFWNSMLDLFSNCSARYKTAHQEKYLEDLSKKFTLLSKQNKGSWDLVEPTGALFMHGLFGCRLYQTSKPTAEELALKKLISENAAPLDQHSMPGFLVNESYIYRDHLAQVKKSRGRYFGIYGNEDGLFAPATLSGMRNAIGSTRFHLVRGASHAVYVDQQKEFLQLLHEIVSYKGEKYD